MHRYLYGLAIISQQNNHVLVVANVAVAELQTDNILNGPVT